MRSGRSLAWRALITTFATVATFAGCRDSASTTAPTSPGDASPQIGSVSVDSEGLAEIPL
jgi:hypothetical protein